MIRFAARKRLGDFSFDVRFESSDRALGIFGPSGHGKSTLLRLLSGLLRPDEGEIQVDGRTLFSSSEGIDVPARERAMGCVFQQPLLFPHLDVRGNLLYGLARSPRRGVDFERAVRLLDLEPLLGRRPSSLSGGEAQRAQIGRALLSSPRLLLLDEPFTGLDGRLKERLLSSLSAGAEAFAIPLVFVSHSLEEIQRLTRTLLVLHEGKAVHRGDALEAIDRGLVYELIRGRGFVNQLEGTVEGVSPGGSALLRVGNQTLKARREGFGAGERARALVPARDVILCRSRVSGLSARNLLSGRLIRAAPVADAVLCHVDIGAELVIEISPEAHEEMRLEPGSEVFCVIKTSAVELVPA